MCLIVHPGMYISRLIFLPVHAHVGGREGEYQKSIIIHLTKIVSCISFSGSYVTAVPLDSSSLDIHSKHNAFQFSGC